MSSWLCCASWGLPHLCWTLWLKALKYLKFTLYFWPEGPKIIKIPLIFSHIGVSGAAPGVGTQNTEQRERAIPLLLFQALISNLPNSRAELLLSHLPWGWKCCIQTTKRFGQPGCFIRKEQESTAGTCRSPQSRDPTGRDLLPPRSLYPPPVLQLVFHVLSFNIHGHSAIK